MSPLQLYSSCFGTLPNNLRGKPPLLFGLGSILALGQSIPGCNPCGSAETVSVTTYDPSRPQGPENEPQLRRGPSELLPRPPTPPLATWIDPRHGPVTQADQSESFEGMEPQKLGKMLSPSADCSPHGPWPLSLAENLIQ